MNYEFLMELVRRYQQPQMRVAPSGTRRPGALDIPMPQPVAQTGALNQFKGLPTEDSDIQAKRRAVFQQRGDEEEDV